MNQIQFGMVIGLSKSITTGLVVSRPNVNQRESNYAISNEARNYTE
jgi:hypothetical protein